MKLDKLQPIEGLLADLYHAMLQSRGWSFVRIGDGEVSALKCVPDGSTPWIHRHNQADGDSIEFLQQGLRIAYSKADWVGVFNEDAETEKAFINHGIPEPKRQVYAWANRHLTLFSDFMAILRKEPVLLIGRPMAAWAKLCGLSRATVFAGNTSPHNVGDIKTILKTVGRFDGRLVLASLGVWAKSVCNQAKQTGRIGIDFGHAADYTLLGALSPNDDKD